jgi:hypothetical protein
MTESITGGDEAWKKDFSKRADEALGAAPEEKSIDSYIMNQVEIEGKLAPIRDSLPPEEYEMIVHMVAGYMSEPMPEERDTILKRIQFMAQTEESVEKRERLEIAIKLIQEGKL